MNLQKYYNIDNVVFIYFYDISIGKKYYRHGYDKYLRPIFWINPALMKNSIPISGTAPAHFLKRLFSEKMDIREQR